MSTTDQLDTQRTKVLDALKELFPERSTPEGVAFEEVWGVGFSYVTREPIGKLANGKISSLGIFGGDAQRQRRSSWTECTMPVVAELHVAKEGGGDGLAKTMERYVGVVEAVLRENKTLGGLIADLEVTSDSVDVDSPYGAQVDGALYFTVRYFQHTDDPRQGRA